MKRLLPALLLCGVLLFSVPALTEDALLRSLFGWTAYFARIPADAADTPDTLEWDVFPVPPFCAEVPSKSSRDSGAALSVWFILSHFRLSVKRTSKRFTFPYTLCRFWGY